MLVRCLLAVVAILVLSATQADARRGFGVLRFGTQEEAHFLEEVRLKGPRGQTLHLGYMTRTQNFGLPIYVRDAGYVLTIADDRENYFHMPTGAELARLQQSGALPKPLPPYRLTAGTYVMGYFLWIVLIVFGIGYAIWAALYRHVDDTYEGAYRAVAEAERARRV